MDVTFDRNAFHYRFLQIRRPAGLEVRAIPTRAGMARNSAQRSGSHGGTLARGFQPCRKFSGDYVLRVGW